MNEGFWLNGRLNKFQEVNEHAMWIADSKNAKKIGLPSNLFEKIKELNPSTDRVEILTTAMSGGLIRVRGHGGSVTFEFSMKTTDALWAIYAFLKKIGVGEYTQVYVANVRTHENLSTTYKDFKEVLVEEGEEALLRAAHKNMKFNYKLKKVTKEILREANEQR